MNRAWRESRTGRPSLSRPRTDCPPCDIAPAKALGPVDQVDGAIRALAGFLHGTRHCGHVEHAPAIGEQAIAVAPGAGMENLHAGNLGGGVEPADLAAPRIG